MRCVALDESTNHASQPVTGDVTDIEKELLIPPIQGARAILDAAKKEKSVKRIVFTSSIATAFNPTRPLTEEYTYTAADWNPITYEEAKAGPPRAAYRAGKKFAELAFWDCIRKENPHFDLVVLCPPYIFGPVVHPVARVQDLNFSCRDLWLCTHPSTIPAMVANAWVDVRVLAVAHAEALLRPECSNERYLVAAPEPYSFQLASDIIREEFDWAKAHPLTGKEGQAPPAFPRVDGSAATKAFDLRHADFKTCVIDSISQYKRIEAQQ